MKIVINKCFGGFVLSKKAYKFMGFEWDGFGFGWMDHEKRCDPELVKCVEVLGKEASGPSSHLAVVDVPDGVEWEIDEYAGYETIQEKHRIWR